MHKAGRSRRHPNYQRGVKHRAIPRAEQAAHQGSSRQSPYWHGEKDLRPRHTPGPSQMWSVVQQLDALEQPPARDRNADDERG